MKLKNTLLLSCAALFVAGCNLDAPDQCPDDPYKSEKGICGCGVSDKDTDGDTIPDCVDTLPNLKNGEDADGDGIPNIDDSCPFDKSNQCCTDGINGKEEPGFCGCRAEETDSDGDTLPDCVDICKEDPNKIYINEEGTLYAVTLKDGKIDKKTETTNICGCGTAETDSDNDTVPDCNDVCPNNGSKKIDLDKGVCECDYEGDVNADTDDDTIKDCVDLCPEDPNKYDESNIGECQCGEPETDLDGDTIKDCKDVCPENENITTEAERDASACGCDKECLPCPEGALLEVKGVCGCYIETITDGENKNTGDADEDGVIDCFDICPNNKLITDSLEEIENLSEYYESEEYLAIKARCDYGDADGDGVLDDLDACPTNPAESSDPENCVYYIEDTYTIRHALDLDKLEQIMYLRTKTGNMETLKVQVLNDINLAYEWKYKPIDDMNFELQKREITYTDDGECIVKSPALYLSKVELIGADSANPPKITATIGDKRCALDNALFNSVTETKIENIKLDLDVSGNGHAILANEANIDSYFTDIEVKGTLRTDATTSSETGVGGLVGTATADQFNTSKLVFTNCYGNGVNVYAPNADNVGGLIGYAGFLYFNFKTKHIAGHIEGSENVGGAFGKLINNGSYSTHINPPDSGMLRNEADEVTGLTAVGGFVGLSAISLKNIINTINSVNGKGGTNVGGLAGKVASTTPITISYIDNQVNTVQSLGQDVGGLAGSVTTQKNAQIEMIKNNVTSVSGTINVGGLIGNVNVETPANDTNNDYGNTIYQYIQNVVNKVENKTKAAACLTASQGTNKKSRNLSLKHVTSTCNLVSSNGDNTVAGLFGTLPKSDLAESQSVYFGCTNVVASSSKVVNDSPVYKPRLYPQNPYTISGTNSIMNLLWYTHGNYEEWSMASTTDTHGSGNSFNESTLTSTVTSLTEMLNNEAKELIKIEQSTFKFTDDDTSPNLPIIKFKDPLMNQR